MKARNFKYKDRRNSVMEVSLTTEATAPNGTVVPGGTGHCPTG